MTGEKRLSALLKSMWPELNGETYVFVSLKAPAVLPGDLATIMMFEEREGRTYILSEPTAQKAGLDAVYPCRMITLNIHSSLEAVGFLAAIATHLAKAGISVNPVSAFYHDHLFVPAERADEALVQLRHLGETTLNPTLAHRKQQVALARTDPFNTTNLPQDFIECLE